MTSRAVTAGGRYRFDGGEPLLRRLVSPIGESLRDIHTNAPAGSEWLRSIGHNRAVCVDVTSRLNSLKLSSSVERLEKRSRALRFGSATTLLGSIDRRAVDRIPEHMAHDSKQGPSDDHGLATAEAKPRLKRPPLYRVILLNDDYTPMEFVVEVLQKMFLLGPQHGDAHHAGGAYQGKGSVRCLSHMR